MNKVHQVKSWAHFFDAIVAGQKKHDLRVNDRDFEVGDTLVLERYDNILGRYTGQNQCVVITYMTSSKVPCAFSSAILPKEYVILSLELVE